MDSTSFQWTENQLELDDDELASIAEKKMTKFLGECFVAAPTFEKHDELLVLPSSPPGQLHTKWLGATIVSFGAAMLIAPPKIASLAIVIIPLVGVLGYSLYCAASAGSIRSSNRLHKKED